MAYQALYRRLRPQTFDAVVGQQHIVKTLQNQIAAKRISHAYLFCGTRGTGKTSMAKIFARAINCTSEGEVPCNECENCRETLNGQNVNVVELDAASNNGVENVRDIIEELKFPPSSGKYRVYIVDEVHMLTTSAFNALLKTLEEPPAHVVFILATTDPQKLPSTVLSRCQRFDFNRISVKEMTAVLADFTKREGVDADEEALEYIAELSDGAMRDALSTLDMCMSFYYNEQITAQKVREITGASDRSAFFELTEAIAANDSAAALDMINGLMLNGRDLQQFVSEYILHLRNLLISVTVTQTCSALDYAQSYIDKLRAQASELSPAYILELLGLFSQLQEGIKTTRSPRILLEVTCIKACSPMTQTDSAALEKRIINIEEKIEKGVPVSYSAQPAQAAAEPQKKTIVKAIPDDINTIIKNWDSFINTIDREKDPVVRTVLETRIQPAYLEDNFLTLVCDSPSDFSTVTKKRDDIKKYLSAFSEKQFELRPMMHKEYDKRHNELYGGTDDSIRSLDAVEQLKNINFNIDFR
ncbi:MAG: DNA polymerase III subunit gamma/tau [Firmicutes bacterium]|nr:DNA polymerase III subunit gamma/tau [Bacillota bacterium]